MLEMKFTPVAMEDVAADGAVRGYASLFERPDAQGDIVAAGAFHSSLADRRGRGAVKFLWQHDPMAPIGVWDQIEEDAHGLRVAGRLLTDTSLGRDAASLLAAGALDGLSIGFQTRQAEKTSNGRRLLEVDLWEISLVTFPMLAGARAEPTRPQATEPPLGPAPDSPAPDLAQRSRSQRLAAAMADARDALRRPLL